MVRFDFDGFMKDNLLDADKMQGLLKVSQSYFSQIKKRGTIKIKTVLELSKKYENAKRFVL